MIEITQLTNGVWRVRIGLIEESFLLVESALEFVKMKMDEWEQSRVVGMQDTSGT